MLRFSLCFAALAPFCALSACTGGAANTGPEICDNRQDDDGDGKVDCEDSDCANDPACALAGEGEGAHGGEGEGAHGGEGEGAVGEGEGEGTPGDVCGDGVVGTSEECDRNNLGGASCVDLGNFTGGLLRCAQDCTFDTSGCTNDQGGEGEGEGAAAGEGEGEGAAGEGEGEGAAGEGEGEGAAGEGEGEGAPVDEAGGVDSPVAITLPFTEVVNIDPAGDTDCFSFTLPAASTITISADDGGDHSACNGNFDPDVTIFAASDTTTIVDENDDINFPDDTCSLLVTNQAAGDYVVCVQQTPDPNAGALVIDNLTVSIAATPQSTDVGDLTNPKQVGLDFTENTDLVATGAPDVDCYAFAVPSAGTLTIETKDATAAGGTDRCAQTALDTDVQLFDTTTAHNLLGENDDEDLTGGNFCSRLVAAVPAGNFIACVTSSPFLGNTPPDLTGIEVDGTLAAGQFPPVFISEVADPVQPTNGNARFVELFNPALTDDVVLVSSRLRVFSNGSVTGQNVNLSRGATVPASGTYVIAHNATDFATEFPGVTPQQVNAGINGNGNDAYELDLAGVAVDVYGVLGQDGAGQPWEYTDGGAQRVSSVAQGTTTFDVAEWTVTKSQADDSGFTPGTR